MMATREPGAAARSTRRRRSGGPRPTPAPSAERPEKGTGGEDGGPQPETPPPEGTGQGDSPAPPGAAGTAEAPPGLGAKYHAAAQRSAREAEILQVTYFPASMASALRHDAPFSGSGFKCYLEQFLAAAGNPTDPVVVMLLRQMVFADLRLAQLHVQAAQAQQVDAAKIYASACARLMGESRRTALAVQVLRGKTQPDTIRLAKVG